MGSETKERIIGHLDMDAFFAAVEEREHKWLKGKPIVVGADPQEGRGRGVVSTANYKAREYGIGSAMPISNAWQASEKARKEGKPPAVFLYPDFSKYESTSQRIFKILRRYAELVEPASIDEGYFDLSSSGSFEKAQKICKQIKEEIRKKEKLTCSIGLGPNKLIAKIASGAQKPDGLTIIGSDNPKTCRDLVEKFLEPLSIRKIPGIGPKTEKLLNSKQIKTVKDLKSLRKEALEDLLGKWGIELYHKARGMDDGPVTEEYEIKSIGEQETFAKDSSDSKFIIERLNALNYGVFKRLKESEFNQFRTVVITVRFEDFSTFTRSYTLPDYEKKIERLQFETLKLLLPFLEHKTNPLRKRIRLIGVRVEKLK